MTYELPTFLAPPQKHFSVDNAKIREIDIVDININIIIKD